MLIHLPLSKAERIPRPYGSLQFVTAEEAGFENLRIHIITVQPGKYTSKHYHPIEEFFFILGGNALFMSENENFRIGENDSILVPPNCVHQIINDGDEPLVYLVAMSPPRDPDTVVYVD